MLIVAVKNFNNLVTENFKSLKEKTPTFSRFKLAETFYCLT